MPLYAIEGKRPVLGANVWVAPSADVIGEAALGDEVSIWFGAVIRGDNSLISVGARTNIQDGAMLHSDPGIPLTIGSDCTIGHHAILHGCTVGDKVLIGMGAVVLNQAVIGDGCIVGAGALVTQGKSFPPGSLIVGSPARAVRAVTDEEVASLTLSSAGYVARGKSFAGTLTRID